MRPQTCCMVHCINLTVKGRILSLGTLEVENKQYPLYDFCKVGLPKSTRVSIHGIPLHVEDEEISQWLENYLVIDGKVQLGTINKKKNPSERFNKLFSGNRFCYTKEIKKPIPRYTKLT